MNDDTTQLVRQLCTRAGMLMEDVSPLAILVGGSDAQALAEITREIGRTADTVLILARAALALLELDNAERQTGFR